jgi:hypothetical protein
MASITNFISNFKGGTRRNRFLVTAQWPTGVVNNVATYHILSASMPPSALGRISIPHRGRLVHYAGDREYADWDIAILDDTNKTLWGSFQQWHKKLNEHAANTHSSSTDAFRDLKTDWVIKHLDANGNALKQMTLKGCFPNIVGGIEFDMNSQIYNTFSVKLSYDYFIG